MLARWGCCLTPGRPSRDVEPGGQVGGIRGPGPLAGLADDEAPGQRVGLPEGSWARKPRYAEGPPGAAPSEPPGRVAQRPKTVLYLANHSFCTASPGWRRVWV